jgi:excisionase family DNA binding protein
VGDAVNLELFDADRAAQILGMKRKRVVDLAAKGIIPAVKIGKLWRFRASWLDEWMTEQKESRRRSRVQITEEKNAETREFVL